ncbi:MAG: hypothetical protein ACOVLC_08460 [Flavobacterium sp.]
MKWNNFAAFKGIFCRNVTYIGGYNHIVFSDLAFENLDALINKLPKNYPIESKSRCEIKQAELNLNSTKFDFYFTLFFLILSVFASVFFFIKLNKFNTLIMFVLVLFFLGVIS